MPHEPDKESNLNFLDIPAKFILIYLSLKLIIFPIVQTGINVLPNLASREKISVESIKIPDLTFPDVTLLLIILLFQPQTSKIFETLDISAQGGLKAQFRKLEDKVDQAKADLDKLQQKQIDELNQLQRFMYPLLLTPGEIEKLKNLKEKSENNTAFDFYVSNPAAAELRRLRDSKLIALKTPYQYISDLERASNYAETDKDFIDLTQYCEITEAGEEFLSYLNNISNIK
ncbi:MAG: hypothetical protein P5702_21005 [Limnospira sp. PMC 1291.21]|uniref:hypothetical protein n=1 Tax=unclassified Limnospira TaxID=2642885 RepID=UPI0028E148FF|nr:MULTISPECIES: hypothetical protein [unclassified Limnospira]MDT9180112.1 hypothetical protein [Limnospira sp. PMC 1238.20]MDT9195390.1 hypothetical protein [Limnospira sp. PMC 1245.20]MDT9205619.1 hypothetical protein [Limnospira sp. PMC 1243.20]MDT9210778.1 hypothetical protein [Limnospira sp. PMC 1252.20]MDT9215860.1 hypothetical protein [Limnospira sp. PMC 1256.20]